mgnify:FL=1
MYPVEQGLQGRNKEENENALFLYIFYRVGIVCPELVRVLCNIKRITMKVIIEVDEDASISFRDYEQRGIQIGKVRVALLSHGLVLLHTPIFYNPFQSHQEHLSLCRNSRLW